MKFLKQCHIIAAQGTMGHISGRTSGQERGARFTELAPVEFTTCLTVKKKTPAPVRAPLPPLLL